MKLTRHIAVAIPALALALAAGTARSAAPAQTPAPPAQSGAQAFINQYCVTCHNQTAKTAGL
ncbi:MAG TPA: hypothetical protein VFY29_08870, partial [Terriglobia bacterium]|nr:hypothetical protein [Terriglobia bacterium]